MPSPRSIPVWNAVAGGIDTVTEGNGVDLVLDAGLMQPSGTRIEGVTVNLGDGDVDLTLQHRLRHGGGGQQTRSRHNDKIRRRRQLWPAAASSAKVDKIVFQGSTSITDGQFAQVTNMPVVVLAKQAGSITLGANAERPASTRSMRARPGTGLRRCSAMKNGITIIGSGKADAFIGSDGRRPHLRGGGRDILNGGKGSDTFVYLTAADSMMFSSGTSFDRDVDGIFNFNSTDQFDFSAFGFAVGMTDAVTDASFVSSDTVGFSRARRWPWPRMRDPAFLYVDANQNGTSTPDPTCSSSSTAMSRPSSRTSTPTSSTARSSIPDCRSWARIPQHDNHAVRPGTRHRRRHRRPGEGPYPATDLRQGRLDRGAGRELRSQGLWHSRCPARHGQGHDRRQRARGGRS